MKKSTLTIHANILQALKDFRKEYKRDPDIYAKSAYSYNSGRDMENLAWKLDQNDISVNYILVEGESHSYTLATYHLPSINLTVILDWDATTVFTNQKALIDEVTRLELKGRSLNASFKKLSLNLK